jgi:hypothetical protein
VTKRGPNVTDEEATLVAERGSKHLLHLKTCTEAPKPEDGVYLRDEAQAELYGYDALHGCLKQ